MRTCSTVIQAPDHIHFGNRRWTPVSSLSLLLILSLLFGTGSSNAQNGAAMQQWMEKRCGDCHTGQEPEGEFDLSKLLGQTPRVKELDTWRNVAQRISLGDMPPAGEERLKEGEKRAFADWYQREITDFPYSEIAHPGYEPIRRLTHSEYRNTLRDLVGIDLVDLDHFPQDLSSRSGFDNSANTLFLQGSLFEKYSQSAESVITQLFDPQASHSILAARKKILTLPDSAAGLSDELERNLFVLTRFTRRAFRRPLTEAEESSIRSLFLHHQRQGTPPAAALQKTMIAVLIMPQFLMKTETVPDGSGAEPVDDYAIASRLSYFLWASMPDETLFQLASEGQLSNPTVRATQVARMLRNRRAKSLGYVFAAQWLGFEEVGVRRRLDPIDNPWCTESLMTAMRSESALFFYSLLRDNHPISRLVDARYTYLNEELASHYRIKGIEGEKMRPVRLKTKIRGGILTHASILSVTSFPDRTSPVVRGHWVLDTLLGTPPPEPPPDVGEIEDDVLERDDLSFREKVEMHSRERRCAACHQEMDPIGFSLENFDNFGRWRTRQYDERINARGRLPDGTVFEGPLGLRDVIVDHRMDDLTRQLAEKLLTYALGRQLEYYDEAALRKIVDQTRQQGDAFQSLLLAIVESYPFLYRQTLPGDEH